MTSVSHLSQLALASLGIGVHAKSFSRLIAVKVSAILEWQHGDIDIRGGADHSRPRSYHYGSYRASSSSQMPSPCYLFYEYQIPRRHATDRAVRCARSEVGWAGVYNIGDRGEKFRRLRGLYYAFCRIKAIFLYGLRNSDSPFRPVYIVIDNMSKASANILISALPYLHALSSSPFDIISLLSIRA